MKIKGVDSTKIKSVSELAYVLDSSPEEIDSILLSKMKKVVSFHVGKGYSMKNLYREIVKVSDDSYRHLLKRIVRALTDHYSLVVPPTVHGFVKGRSIISNAQAHTRQKIVLNVDIRDFFNSISKTRVSLLFSYLGFQKDLADILANLVTVNDILPTGFATSPILSNLICLDLDAKMIGAFSNQKYVYTRYADDITLSTSQDSLLSLNEIKTVLNSEGFRLNEDKVRLYRRGGPQYVTGLTVVDSKPRLSKKLKRKIRLEMYYMKKFGVREHVLREMTGCWCGRTSPLTSAAINGYGVTGYVAYIYSVEQKLGKELFEIFGTKDKSRLELLEAE